MNEAGVASIGTVLGAGRQALTDAAVDTPRLDAEVLLSAALGVGRERLVIDRDRPLTGPERDRFGALIARRVAREPVAYILGRRDFRRLTLDVDSRVLIPRPETELLVETALALPEGARVLDVGTGSGAIALALKDERPDLVLCGSDASPDALAVARGNAARLGLEVTFVQSDLLAAVDGPWDAVLANLPYVTIGALLAPEITRFEPPGALFSGADGLDLVRRLIAAVSPAAVGFIALEIGPEQAAEVARLVRAAGYGTVDIRQDLAGRDRVVVGRA